MSDQLLWSFLPGHPRWTTVLMAVAILAVVTWRTRRPFLAVVAVVAWLAAVEIAWEGGQLIYHRDPAGQVAWFAAAVVAWPILGHVLGIRPDRWLLALFALAFVAWLAIGFPYNWPGQPVVWSREPLNVLAKTALGIAYLLGALRVAR